jgi:hypothetical protein
MAIQHLRTRFMRYAAPQPGNGQDVMHIFFGFSRLLLILLLPGISTSWAQDTGEVGHVVVVKGQAQARQSDGTTRDLSRRSPIRAAETLITAPDSSLQVLLNDNTQFVLRSDSEFSLEAYDENALNLRQGKLLLMSMARGCIRYMTGNMGVDPRDDVRLDTPHASLQINTLVVFESCSYDENQETAVSAGALDISNHLGTVRLDYSGQFDFAETLAGQAPTGSRVQAMPPVTAPPPASTGPVRLRPQEDFDIIPFGGNIER